MEIGICPSGFLTDKLGLISTAIEKSKLSEKIHKEQWEII